MNAESAPEVAKLREQARDAERRTSLDQDLLDFFAVALSRTPLSRCAPRSHESWKAWEDRLEGFPDVVATYVYDIKREIEAERQAADRTRNERERAEQDTRIAGRVRDLLANEPGFVADLIDAVSRKVKEAPNPGAATALEIEAAVARFAGKYPTLVRLNEPVAFRLGASEQDRTTDSLRARLRELVADTEKPTSPVC